MSKQVIISGTDPTNPRCAAHIVERLEQIHRDLSAMARELGRERIFAGRLVDILIDQGAPGVKAVERVHEITKALQKIEDEVSDASHAAHRTADAIIATRVNLKASFEWRKRT